MSQATVHQQLHGYRKGHQLLSASLVLDSRDQDTVDRLSDLTGRLRPGELFDPYLTAYPLPSQAYYVVARTFQDLEAPRSGCVLTRSMLIHMNAWVELTNLEWLSDMLVPIDENEEARPLDKPPGRGRQPEKVRDGRVVELVQALFLEDGRPIVVFGAPEADLIATRLLVALWPGLRRGFSICTLALGPRRLGERDFDLVFAPLTVQSRFSGEAFYRIGVRGSMPSEALHHWAAPTAARIFHSDEPCLAARDVLGLMAEDELRNRSAVRMVLRWDELASRAKTTPTAVLGMLDILNSRGGLGRRGWDRLSPMVYAALDSATVRSSPQESWDFLFALNAKVEWSTAPAALADKLERAARSLARGAPEEALEAVEELHADVYGSAAVLNGVADGVAESPAFEALSECLSRLEPNVLLRLVAASDRLGEALVTAMNATADRWLDMVVRVLEGDDASARRRVRRRLVSLVDDAVAGKTVPRMLADVGGAELADLAVELGRRGRFRSEPINAALVEAARHTGSVDVVRDAVVSHVQSGDADAFLLKFVELTGPDLEWLLGLSDGGLAGRLLTALLADAEAMAIQSVLSQGGQAPRVVSVLRAVLPTSASEIARILQFGLMPSRAGLDVGFDVVSTVLPKERRSLEKWLLREVLSVARPGDSRVGQAIAEFRDRLTAEELVAAATAASIGPRRLSENLVALNGAPRDVRDGVVGIVDTLSRHLVERRWEELDEAAYCAWAEMLADAGAADPERQIKAAGTVFGFALRQVSYPASALVVTAFPTIFREHAKLKELGGLGRSWLGISSDSWFSWKKPKDVRRELIDVLVGVFLRSSWPPADLIVTALKAGIGKRVVKRVRKQHFGARYLERIGKDAGRLDEELRRRVLACVADTA